MTMSIGAVKQPLERDRSLNVRGMRVGVIAGFAAFVAASSAAYASPAAISGATMNRVKAASPVVRAAYRPWIEGVDPVMENQLFYATYGVLQSHNVLKVYAFSAGGYESAGIRFSGRVPHEARDLTLAELAREAVVLIHTTFDDFPEIQHVDVWATVPVAQSQATSVENTVFSVSADRDTYARIAEHGELADLTFLNAFGRLWVAPQVPR